MSNICGCRLNILVFQTKKKIEKTNDNTCKYQTFVGVGQTFWSFQQKNKKKDDNTCKYQTF